MKRLSSIKFWGLLLLLNVLLFLPDYFFEQDIASLFPSLSQEGYSFFESLFVQPNLNPFRFSIDLLLLTFLYTLFYNSTKGRKGIAILLKISYILFISYNIYRGIYLNMYGIKPKFLDDYVLIQEVLPIFLSSIGQATLLNYAIVFFGILLLFGLLIFIINKMFKAFEGVALKTNTVVGLLVMLVLALTMNTVLKEKVERKEDLNFQWLSKRVAESARFDNPGKWKTVEKSSAYHQYFRQQLETKPNIYFLFLEAYGAVAYLSEYTSDEFRASVDSLQKRLNDANWHIASTYSKAPVMGGRSWLSYTSGLTGVLIENQVHYNNLIYENVGFPHLVRFLKWQGYDTYRMSTMRSNEKTDTLIPYEKLNQFWGFDHFTKYDDIAYKGYEYDFFGGLPDQYALGYVRDSVMAFGQDPMFLFFITLTSHGPWYPPPPVLEDWKMLDTIQSSPHPVPRDLSPKIMTRYLNAVEYELEVVTQFIENTPGNNLYILVGDHQPIWLESLLRGIYDEFAVPLHFVSQDSSMIASFYENGFDNQLNMDTSKVDLMKHEGIYSILIKKLVENYGSNKNVELPYLPEGLE